MTIEQRNAATLATAQRAYDHAAPDDLPEFLHTDVGIGWLFGEAENVLAGDDIKIDKRTYLDNSVFANALGRRMMGKIGKADFDEIGYLFAALISGDLDKAQRQLAQLCDDEGAYDMALSVARDCLRPYADKAEAYIHEQARLEATED